MQVQVISGSKRGAKLISIDGLTTRPTASRMKEALFNIIQFQIMDSRFCDLFSGSGAMGIEALSRGAESVAFVDSNKACADVINKNLTHTKLGGSAEIHCMDCLEAIANFNKCGRQFDIIFCDPPYEKGFPQKIAESIVKNEILAESGILIFEQQSDEQFPEVKGLIVTKIKKYTKTAFVFMEVSK